MVSINENYKNLKESYLFTDIAKKVASFSKENPNAKIIKMGIGDVTQPLIPEVVEAMKKASAEMGEKSTFRGYGPEQGYLFLREKIVQYYYEKMNVNVDVDEVFVSDGAKSDLANITDLFSQKNIIAVPDPVYPVYVDSNVMLGRKIVYLNGNIENGFLPSPESVSEGDIIYLCSPNNPTGAAFSKEQLQKWVDFAKKNHSVILYDAAYEAFIVDDIPRSIFEIDGAKDCAIEFCSYSKTAGFTGTRCGYTVVPKNLLFDGMSINKMWLRRQTTKFNGVSYVTQKGAEAIYLPSAWNNIQKTIGIYRENALTIAKTMDKKGIWYTGGKNSPYIWFKCPDGISSWDYFDFLLHTCEIVCTPGSGFGQNGEGFIRLTAFNTPENTKTAMERFDLHC